MACRAYGRCALAEVVKEVESHLPTEKCVVAGEVGAHDEACCPLTARKSPAAAVPCFTSAKEASEMLGALNTARNKVCNLDIFDFCLSK